METLDFFNSLYVYVWEKLGQLRKCCFAKRIEFLDIFSHRWISLLIRPC